MAERIQLKEPGSEMVMLVASVRPETVEKNDYYLFTNQIVLGGAEMLVPQSSVKAQIERLGITAVEQMIGKWVRFGRSMKMSRANRPYWDIDWAPERNGSGAEAPSQSAGGEMGKPTAGTSASAPSAEPAPSEKPRLDRIYLRATKVVLDDVVPLYTKAGIGCTDTAVAAMVATLFIAASKVEAQ